jgi:hypothetical protein
MSKKVGVDNKTEDRKIIKKGHNIKRGKGTGFEQIWTDEKRKKLNDALIAVAQDEVQKEYTIKQICYRAGHSYDTVEELKNDHADVRATWLIMKGILQKRWLELAIENKGNSKVVSQFLDYHSREVTKSEDDREYEQFKRIEKVKTDEKIRSQQAFVDNNEEVITNIISSAAQAIQDISKKNKKNDS